ncbi:MAG: hypothetical protein RLZZ385_203 [Pseudomonadota bacterium]
MLLLAILPGACTVIDLDLQFDRNPGLQEQVLQQQADAFPHIDPLQLSDEIRQFADQHIRPNDRDFDKVEKLQDLLFGPDHLNLQYSDARTQTAIEVFESREGNCLSVMNLYVALARYVGLDASFQTVKVRPTWDRRGGLLVLNQHINATGRITARETYVVDFTPEISVQQLTSQVVTDELARALYFNNLGVESMVAGDFEQARVYLRNALWINPELSIAWNNIGTVYNRLQQHELAEYSYQMSFESDTTNATAISNLARFYVAQGDDDTAARYRRAITRFNRLNPYYHYEQGNLHYQEGDLVAAAESYERAVRIKDVEPDFYLALAQTYRLLGNDRQAIRMAVKADELLNDTDQIWQPSDQKVRFIDSSSIIGNGPGLILYPNRRRSQ